MHHILSFLHDHKLLCITVTLLWVLGLFMMFIMTGHDFLGLALVGIGALLIFYTLCADLLPVFPIIRILRTAVTLILAVCVGYFCVVESFIIRDARTDTEQTADVLIVLGAGVNGTRPSLSLRDRMVGAYDYLIAHPDCIAVVSGGQGVGEDITDAQCKYCPL